MCCKNCDNPDPCYSPLQKQGMTSYYILKACHNVEDRNKKNFKAFLKY